VPDLPAIRHFLYQKYGPPKLPEQFLLMVLRGTSFGLIRHFDKKPARSVLCARAAAGFSLQ